MKTEMIEVPYFEGYKCLGYRLAKEGQYLLIKDRLEKSLIDCEVSYYLVYEKLPPKRHIFEETGEFRSLIGGECGLDIDGGVFYWTDHNRPSRSEYKLLQKIEEE